MLCKAQTISGIYRIKTFKTLQGRSVNETDHKPLLFSFAYHNNISKQHLIEGGGTVKKDTIIVDDFGEVHFVNGSIVRPSNVVIYKDFENNEIKVNFTVNGTKRSIEDSIRKFNWELHNEKKVILGYSCKKATTVSFTIGFNQNITAWYSEALSISDGPSHFNGLPGLILELETDDITLMKFEKIETYQNQNILIEEPETFAPLNFEQYYMIHGFKDY